MSRNASPFVPLFDGRTTWSYKDANRLGRSDRLSPEPDSLRYFPRTAKLCVHATRCNRRLNKAGGLRGPLASIPAAADLVLGHAAPATGN